MGLVHVLENLAQPEELGHLIAAAFIATLWGVLSANVIWLPIGNRLKRLGELEAARMELVIEGVLAIQAGSNPRVIAAEADAPCCPAGEQAPRPRRPDMSRRRRAQAREEHEEHENHERWLVTYADMITLLMVLFIVHVRDEQRRPEEVQRAQGGPRRRLRRSRRPSSTGPTSILDQPGVSRSPSRSTPTTSARRRPRSPSSRQAVAEALHDQKQQRYAEAAAEADRLARC